MKKTKTTKSKKPFQQNKRKLHNNFAAAYNEATVNFPSSDTIGGAAVLNDGQMTIQSKEPIYDTQPIKDPIISEVSIINPENGGGIVKDMIGIEVINDEMNPDGSIEPTFKDDTRQTEATVDESTNKKFPWIILAIVVIVIAAFLLIRKK